MNISELKSVIDSAHMIRSIKYEKTNNNNSIRFSGLKAFREGLRNLYGIKKIFPQIEKLLNDVHYKKIQGMAGDSVEVGAIPINHKRKSISAHWCPTVEKINSCNHLFLNKI